MNISILFIIFIIGISYGSHAPLVPVFAREEINANYIEVGEIGMVNYLPYLFVPILVGLLLDRFNKSAILSIGITISTLSIFLLSFASNVIDMMVIRAFAGLAHAFIWPAATSIVSETNSRSVKSISRFTMFWVGGYMIGPIIGSLLFESFGFRALFQYTSLFMIIALLLSSILIKKVKNITNGREDSIRDILIMFHDNLRVHILIIYYSAAFGITLSILPAYMKEHGINEQEIGLLFFIFGLARLLTLLFTDKLASSSSKILIIAILSISFAMLILYSMIEFTLFMLAVTMLGFSFSIYFPLTLNLITKDVPNEMIGRYIGAYETVFGLGWAIAPFIAGILSDIFTSNTPYLIMFVIGLFMPLMMLRFNSK
ncbi:MAG: MFS transporter [Candidatus Nitrosocaldaceae archaeon]